MNQGRKTMAKHEMEDMISILQRVRYKGWHMALRTEGDNAECVYFHIYKKCDTFETQTKFEFTGSYFEAIEKANDFLSS